MAKVILLLSLFLATPCFAAVDFESGTGNGDSGDGCLWHADGLDTDISGADATVTVCAWVKIESTPSGSIDYAIAGKVGWAGATCTDAQYSLFVGTGATTPGFLVEASDETETVATSSESLTLGTWYSVCGVYDDTAGTDTFIYVNGVERGSATHGAKGIVDTGCIFAIGAWDGGVAGISDMISEWDGEITEVAIWNVAATAAQIAALSGGRPTVSNSAPIKGLPLLMSDLDGDGTSDLMHYAPLDEKPLSTGVEGAAFIDMAKGNTLTGNDDDADCLTTGETVLYYPSIPIIY